MAVASEPGKPVSSPPPGSASPRAGTGSSAWELIKRLLTLREASIIVVTIIAIAIFGFTTTNFMTGGNFKTLLPYFAPYAIMAAGEVFVMTLGEIDLSIGAVYLITPFLFWKFNTSLGLPLVPAVLLALVVACLIGALNGFMTAWIKIPSFVATLGTLFTLEGVALIISHSEQVNTPGTSVVGSNTFSNVLGAGTYSELFWAIGIVLVLQVLLSFTRWGLYTVSVGGNKHGAAEAGINTRLVVLRSFVLAALFSGFTGILEAVRTSSMTPDPSGANGILLLVVAAVIIGGTVMTGGSGTVIGALIGALFLGVLTDGLIVKGVDAKYEDLYLGLAIIIAMIINVYIQRVRTGSGRG